MSGPRIVFLLVLLAACTSALAQPALFEGPDREQRLLDGARTVFAPGDHMAPVPHANRPARQALRELRLLIWEQRPSALSSAGLVRALEQLQTSLESVVA